MRGFSERPSEAYLPSLCSALVKYLFEPQPESSPVLKIVRFPKERSFSKKHRVHKESVSKQGRKFAKGESSVQRDPLFDEVPEDTVDHMDTENAQDEGRTREIVDEEQFSTDRPIVSTDGSKVSTDKQIKGTDEQVEGTEEPNEGTEEQNEDTVENFEGTEENIEGTEEKSESTDGHKKGTEEEIAAQSTQTSTQTPHF
ncbi:hypothetical protein Tco_0665185 [Tanacetum coccineum]